MRAGRVSAAEGSGRLKGATHSALATRDTVAGHSSPKKNAGSRARARTHARSPCLGAHRRTPCLTASPATPTPTTSLSSSGHFTTTLTLSLSLTPSPRTETRTSASTTRMSAVAPPICLGRVRGTPSAGIGLRGLGRGACLYLSDGPSCRAWAVHWGLWAQPPLAIGPAFRSREFQEIFWSKALFDRRSQNFSSAFGKEIYLWPLMGRDHRRRRRILHRPPAIPPSSPLTHSCGGGSAAAPTICLLGFPPAQRHCS